MNEDVLLAGLHKFAKGDQEFDGKMLPEDLPGVLRMDARLPFDDRLTKVQSSLFKYLRRLRSVLSCHGEGEVETGDRPYSGESHASHAVGQGVTTGDRSLGRNSLHHGQPEGLLQVMESEGIFQKVVEERRMQNMATARKEVRNANGKTRRESKGVKGEPLLEEDQEHRHTGSSNSVGLASCVTSRTIVKEIVPPAQTGARKLRRRAKKLQRQSSPRHRLCRPGQRAFDSRVR